jgi:hypothetical protein
MKLSQAGMRLRAGFARRGVRFSVMLMGFVALLIAAIGVGSYALADGFGAKSGLWTDLRSGGKLPEYLPNAVACDPQSGSAYLFYSPLPQSLVATWTYEVQSNSFHQVGSSGTEPQLAGFELGYDENTRKVICFGYPMYAHTVETWAYDPATERWTQLHPSVSPAARDGACMAYDRDLGKVVLFQGNAPGAPGDRTWAYDASAGTWVDLKTNGAPPAFEATMAYDPVSGRLLLFGGIRALSSADADDAGTADPEPLLGDTWAYDAQTNTWTDLKPAVEPPAREIAGLAYDKASGKMILFGGEGVDKMFADTWAYDSLANTWLRLNTAGSPGGRIAAALFPDQGSGRLILCGGAGSDRVYSDAWAFSY